MFEISEFSFDGARLLASFLAGGLLAMSGGLIQAVTQNDLAGPDTLGLNAYVVLIILLGHLGVTIFENLPALEMVSLGLFVILTPLFLLLGSFFKRRKIKMAGEAYKDSKASIILLGLCFNLFVGAIFSALYFIFTTMNLSFPSQLWYGNFRFISDEMLGVLGVVAPILYIANIKLAKKMDPLTFGGELAQGLGVNTVSLERQGLLLSLIATGIVAVFFGIFSFMGLIFPHLLRSVSFFRCHISRELVLGPFVCGGIFSFLDLLCFNFPLQGAEIPVGMISALLGTFFLLIILLRGKKG